MTDDRDFPQTTLHLARAVDGNVESLEWLVGRLSPLLRVHASFRLGSILRRHYDADDLVNDAWVATLPKLRDLVGSAESRRTPILLKYLSNVVVNRISYLARRHARRAEATEPNPAAAQQIPAAQSGAITRAVRREAQEHVHRALDELEPRDREILLLRGIEQRSANAVATMLEVGLDAVNKRYQRALRKLRGRLPASVFDEIAD